MEKAEKRGKVSRMLGDGAYDSAEAFQLLRSRGIEAAVKRRRNSRPDTPSPARRTAVRLHKHLGHEYWSKAMRYGKR